MIAFVASVTLAAAAATPPPTILHEKVSPVCSTLHQVVIPLAQMNIKNRPILESVRALQLKLAQARRTYLGDAAFLYGSQIDQAFSNIIQNINEVDKALLKSYAVYPQGQNSKVDALRRRVQNVLDLERVMANARAASFAAAVDNDGVTGIETSLNHLVSERQPPHPPATPLPNDIVPFGSPPRVPDESTPADGAPATPLPRAVADNDPRLAGTVPPGFSLRMLKWTRFPELQSLLHREGPALEAQTLIAARDCDGV